jgi:hypothetical protein
MTSSDAFIVIASDGVFEFLTNQMVGEIVEQHKDDPLAACKAIISASYHMWLQYEVRTDDITVIVISLRDNSVGNSLAISKFKSSENLSLQEDDKDFVSIAQVESVDHRPVRRNISREKKKHLIVNNETKEDPDDDQDIESLVVEKNTEDTEAILMALKNNFLFHHLNPSQRNTVVNLMQPLDIKKGDRVINQGEQGDRYDEIWPYIIGLSVWILGFMLWVVEALKCGFNHQRDRILWGVKLFIYMNLGTVCIRVLVNCRLCESLSLYVFIWTYVKT